MKNIKILLIFMLFDFLFTLKACHHHSMLTMEPEMFTVGSIPNSALVNMPPPHISTRAVMVDVYPHNISEGLKLHCLYPQDFLQMQLLKQGVAFVFLTAPVVVDQTKCDVDQFDAISQTIHTLVGLLPSRCPQLARKPLWLMGRSFGATITLYHALYSNYPGDFNGYLAIAPYIGWRPKALEPCKTGEVFSSPPKNRLRQPLCCIHGSHDYVSNSAGFFHLYDACKHSGSKTFNLHPLVIQYMRHQVSQENLDQHPELVSQIVNAMEGKGPPPSLEDRHLEMFRPIILEDGNISAYYANDLNYDSRGGLRRQFLGRLLTLLIEHSVAERNEVEDHQIKSILLMQVPLVLELHQDSTNDALRDFLNPLSSLFDKDQDFAIRKADNSIISPADVDAYTKEIQNAMKEKLGIDVDGINLGKLREEIEARRV